MANVTVKENHEQIFVLLPLYVNQSLDKEETRTVEKHLENCIECQSELAFERSLQESIGANEVDVTDISEKNLPIFNALLDQKLELRSFSAAPLVESELRTQSRNTSSVPLLERLTGFGRTLLTPGPVLGGALSLGCVLVIVGMLSTSDDKIQTQSPLRGCEHVVEQHELRLVAGNTQSVADEAKDILEELFPGASFSVEILGDKSVVVNVTGDTCMVPLLVNDLGKLPSVNSVTVI